MELQKYNNRGETVGMVSLEDGVFGTTVNETLIYEVLRAESANFRQGTHQVKGRSRVNRTKAKPYRQKGTGRARAGKSSSPIWTGGGTVFGPPPRSYRHRLPQKMRRQGVLSILTKKLREKQISLIEPLVSETGKTKDMVSVLKNIDGRKKTVVLGENKQASLIKRALRNVPNVCCLSTSRLQGTDIYNSDMVVMEEDVVAIIKPQGKSHE